ncbi:MAG: single-stranded DNA-binding protein [Lentimicrobium sp.]|jgi:single-strand DNA-binding protein|nr:single-stranded DNA-binding protein [Lentimicrobium sp.]
MNTISNKVQLIGHLGNDPEIKTISGNRKMARFSIATNEVRFNKAGEKITETQWHNIVFWGSLAAVCEKYLSKGQEVAVEGRLGYRMYTDKENINRFITEITGTDLLMISNRKAG